MKVLHESLPYLAILIACLFNFRNIVKESGNTIMKQYGKLADEEKELYDILKVKMSQMIYFLSLLILTILAFVFTEKIPNIITPTTFTIFYLIEIAVLLIFLKTRWILKWFCKK